MILKTNTVFSVQLKRLLCSHTRLFVFSLTIFSLLSVTTVLIDTWGPGIFQKLISPGEKELPHGVLLLFNLGDFCGIIVSIALADRLGRRGSFAIGFFGQSVLFAAMVLLQQSTSAVGKLLVIASGTAASACRCFAWEAAAMWTIEAFQTDLRAMALGIATAVMRTFSIISLEVSGAHVNDISPMFALSLFASLMGLSGILALSLLPLETAGVQMDQ